MSQQACQYSCTLIQPNIGQRFTVTIDIPFHQILMPLIKHANIIISTQNNKIQYRTDHRAICDSFKLNLPLHSTTMKSSTQFEVLTSVHINTVYYIDPIQNDVSMCIYTLYQYPITKPYTCWVYFDYLSAVMECRIFRIYTIHYFLKGILDEPYHANETNRS